jgi:uncharacterized SAM-binding protein YcdF (DUF218 family)
MIDEDFSITPDLIIILGASGMPSPDGLMRTYYGAEKALKFKNAEIIIALPYADKDSLKQLNLMARELILKGVDSARISYEPLGFNTYSQAKNIATLFAKNKQQLSLLIVSSPTHMYRAVRTFRRAGFKAVGPAPAFETLLNEEKFKDKEKTSDKRIKSLTLRYDVWNYLTLEIFVLREYFAIFYYHLKGWI